LLPGWFLGRRALLWVEGLPSERALALVGVAWRRLLARHGFEFTFLHDFVI
jgi:hypothetical protein